MSTIKAVLLDADGVLQRTPEGWLEAVKGLCGDVTRAEEFLADVFSAEQPALVGQRDFSDELSKVLERWQSPVSISQALAVWTSIVPDDAVFARIRVLRSSGVLVGLATNQQQQRAACMLGDLDYKNKFDEIFCSCDIGWAKPAREYFLHIRMRMSNTRSYAPENILFIDDHVRNVDAARAVGLQAEQFHLDQGITALDDILARHGVFANDLS